MADAGSRTCEPCSIPVFKESFGVSVLTYPAGDHAQAEAAVVELGDLVVVGRA